MKTMVRFGLVICLLALSTRTSAAQEMSKDQWQNAITDARQRRDALRKEVESLEADVMKMKSESSTLDQQIDKCHQELMAMLGTTNEGEAAYARLLDNIDAHLNLLSTLADKDLSMRRAELDTVQAMINSARANKLSWLPANDQRLQEQQYRLAMLKQSLGKFAAANEEIYKVGTWAKNRDCLWNIAKKPGIYANAFLWPKIWQDNRDQLTNPDIIRPGEKLKIPPKSPLTTSDNDALRTYWRHKESFASAKHPASETH